MSQAISIKPTRSPTLELITLAAPIIAMTVTRMLMGLIDTWMVKDLGTAALAAISPSTILVFAISCLGMGLVQAVQTFVSQADGRGEPHLAGAYYWQSFHIAWINGVLIIPVAWSTPAWLGAIAEWAGHPAGVRPLEIAYVQIALWSVLPATIAAALRGFFNGIQRPYVGMTAMIASLITNVLLNWLLIWGHWGFPAMGIAGAALATVIAWWVQALWMTVSLWTREIDTRYHTRRTVRIDREKFRSLCAVGLPISLQWIVDMGAWVVFMQVMMPAYGAAVMAATNVAFQYMHLAFMPAVGIGMALCSQVGFAIGEGRPDDAVRRTRVALRVNVIYMGLVGLGFFLLREPAIRVWNDEPDVIAAGAWILIWCAIFQAFDAMCITFINALRGAGDTRIPALMIGAACWVIFVGGGVAATRLLPELGFNGPWIMCTLYIVALGLALQVRFRNGAWRKIELFKADEPSTLLDGESEAALAART